MFYCLESILIFLLFTFIFFLAISQNKKVSRCSKGKECYDGNGKYQYKGRGYKEESVDVLLSRIDWLAKNSSNKSLYTTSYIIAYPSLIAVIFILYAFSKYIMNYYELIVVLISIFIICFSILNLFDFHTDRYPSYYIRQNIKYIYSKLDIEYRHEPPNPSCKSSIPHRSKVRDILDY